MNLKILDEWIEEDDEGELETGMYIEASCNYATLRYRLRMVYDRGQVLNSAFKGDAVENCPCWPCEEDGGTLWWWALNRDSQKPMKTDAWIGIRPLTEHETDHVLAIGTISPTINVG